MRSSGFSVGTINYLHQFYFIAKDIMKMMSQHSVRGRVSSAMDFANNNKKNKKRGEAVSQATNTTIIWKTEVLVMKSASCYDNLFSAALAASHRRLHRHHQRRHRRRLNVK